LGERVLLLNYEHQSAPTPYRASHAIFVRETALRTSTLRDALPPVMDGRAMSLRAFDADGMIVLADLAQPGEATALVERQLADPRVAYVHAHFADYGCYAARAAQPRLSAAAILPSGARKMIQVAWPWANVTS
jgi:hypothetical protein